MKTFSIHVCIIAVLLIIAGCSSPESVYRAGYDFSTVDKVAVVAIEGTVRSEPARNQVAEFFAMELLKKGYAPLGRAQVNALLKEQELQSTDFTTAEGAAQAGQVLNVPAVLVVNIPHFGEEISIIAGMIDVEDGSFLWMGSASAKSEGTQPDVLGYGFQTGGGLLASAENENLLGGIVGGPLVVTGQSLTPGEAKSVQKIVKSICKTLPHQSGQKTRRYWPNFLSRN